MPELSLGGTNRYTEHRIVLVSCNFADSQNIMRKAVDNVVH